MESKRRCCAPAFSPISSPPIGNQLQGNHYHAAIRQPARCCSLRKCKYVRPQPEPEFSSTQRLLDRIRNLKESIRGLEIIQQQCKRNVEKRDIQCQTREQKRSEVHDIREILSNCIEEMTKLRAILDDENCWWKMFKKRHFDCCDQKLPHLHGFLNGTMVTLKILEEKPEQEFLSSTLAKTCSRTNIESSSTSSKRRSRDQDAEKVEDGVGEHTENLTTNSRRSIDFSDAKTDESCKESSCSESRKLREEDVPVAESSREPEESPDQTEPDLEDSQETEDEMSERIDALRERFSRSEWYTKSSMDIGNRVRPSVTFSSENMPRKSVIAADISTSMDLLPDGQYRSIRPSIKSLRDLMESGTTSRQRRSSVKSTRIKVTK